MGSPLPGWGQNSLLLRVWCLPTAPYMDSDSNTPSLLFNDFTHTHSQIQGDICFKSTFHLESPHQIFLFNMLFEIPCFRDSAHVSGLPLGGENCKRCTKGMIMAHRKWQRKQKKNPQNT
ncbi:unnamed protein product [Rangifer tarandus platyrhynchus]|uniref:Uncharacterized protein n=2 Tax=Rangifer tarandus platyrhynchus TaxID=3082113 RepID=A0AC59ZL14_RANTA|nr:unnamed protein product [Rangifer tarandus platyrhynchus]